MRKVYRLMIIVFGIFLLGSVGMPIVLAEDNYDQAYAEVTGCHYLDIGSEYSLAQTFNPGINRISQIQVYLKDNSIDNLLSMRLVNENTKKTIYETSAAMSGVTGWAKYEFYGTEIAVFPGQLYSIQLKSLVPVKWAVNSTNNFAGGSLSIYPNLDALFTVSGFSSDVPVTMEGQTTVLPSGMMAKNNPALEGLTENKAYKKPEIGYYLQNNTRKEVPNDPIRVVKTDSLVIGGTGSPNYQIVLEVGGTALTSQIDSGGNWSIGVNLSDFSEGTYPVSAYIVVSDEKSEPDTGWSIMVSEGKRGILNVGNLKDDNNLVLIIIFFGIILILPALILYFRKRKKKPKRTK